MTEVKDTRVTQLMPRGTDRVRRRQQQAAAIERAREEIATLVSPSTPEKAEKIAQLRAADRAEYGDTKRSRTVTLQGRHRTAADEETAVVSANVPRELTTLRPGEQVDHITARRFMKNRNKQVRDHAMDTAKAVAQSALEVLRGRPAPAAKTSRHRKVAQQAVKQDRIKRAQKTS